jgi:hypothetical protein
VCSSDLEERICWCGIIKPLDDINYFTLNNDTQEFILISSGCVEKEICKQIVLEHNLLIDNFNKYIDTRKTQKEKDCYCGHTIDCDCSNPDYTLFLESLTNKTIDPVISLEHKEKTKTLLKDPNFYIVNMLKNLNIEQIQSVINKLK